ncbi:hypothetical protein [Nonomuraea jiangxiensis]|uniref:Uncharacterized protein n=1 Tax=Nonomuraea jiangxiensis TaxID=633440 RepID=A0A1G8XVZ8_9ACTN|nr:hypothetical protein [Nonomuraea jiangxiensis]SDJ94681.1 hypothetical protein SAMN05421869_11392 [Nonomuraea jiangxiensis]
MARAAVEWLRANALAARCLPVTAPAHGAATDRVDRMARFAAGARRLVVRAFAMGVLVAAGWLLAVVFGMLTAAPAAADDTMVTATTATTAATDVGAPQPHDLTGQPYGLGGRTDASASDNAEAMAGRTVDGLNSQSDPGLPAPSTAGKILDTDGLVPNGGGSGPFGAAAGDVARSVFDPRLQARRAILASVPTPVVRTAADDPSFSPD